MRKAEIRVERPESFFERGRKLAASADARTPIPMSRIIAFADVESLLHVLSEKRLLLLRRVKQEPGSIAELARSLKRDRSTVTRDVQLLARLGVLEVTTRPLPGHGRQKWVAPVARSMQLIAQI